MSTKKQLASEDLAQQHEHLGNAVTRIIADFAASLDSRPVATTATPADVEALFNEDLPESGLGVVAILARITRDIATHAMGVPNPRYFGHFNPTHLPIGVRADALCPTLNQNAGPRRKAP